MITLPTCYKATTLASSSKQPSSSGGSKGQTKTSSVSYIEQYLPNTTFASNAIHSLDKLTRQVYIYYLCFYTFSLNSSNITRAWLFSLRFYWPVTQSISSFACIGFSSSKDWRSGQFLQLIFCGFIHLLTYWHESWYTNRSQVWNNIWRVSAKNSIRRWKGSKGSSRGYRENWNNWSPMVFRLMIRLIRWTTSPILILHVHTQCYVIIIHVGWAQQKAS